MADKTGNHGTVSCWKRASLALGIALLTMLAARSQAQTFTTLHSFDGTDGAAPFGAVVQATDGNLYGTTDGGGTFSHCLSGCGTAFKITLGGTLTTLYKFCSQFGCTDGEYPEAGLVQATDGNFYGTTVLGGNSGGGTVFKIAPGAALTTLYSFDGTDAAQPYAGLVQATDGDLYGATCGIFCAAGQKGGGTVFKMTPTGALTTLYSFCSQSGCTDGENPYAALVQATNANFYGTTYYGGASGAGAVFKITPSGMVTTFYSFCSQSGCKDGQYPYAPLVQATDRNLYGTTSEGGANGVGTVFKITPSGTLTTLYSFCSQDGCTDGEAPYAGLVQATDGNFYGTTHRGGANGDGTAFKITPGGTLTTLYSFCSQSGCTDGSNPYSGLIQDTDGNLYGTTYGGGANGDGTVFSLSVGLGPFVEAQPTSGKVGFPVRILGTNLTGATSVSFNGTVAAFTVISPSLIITAVPAGAATGKVQVVTPSGTLSSNVPFRVRP